MKMVYVNVDMEKPNKTSTFICYITQILYPYTHVKNIRVIYRVSLLTLLRVSEKLIVLIPEIV